MKKSLLFGATLLLLFVFTSVTAVAQTLSVSANSGAFTVVSPTATAQIVVGSDDAPVVGVAAKALASDISLITGKTPQVVQAISTGEPSIICGTLGQSAIINQLASDGTIDISAIKGKWEAYSLQLTSKGLVIVGSTPRGTAYGIFHLSRLAGVSPWVWWADVKPELHENLYVSGTSLTLGEPDVKYRGIFINDEDWGLQPWAAKNMDTDIADIGPKTYAKVCELLLRLRANLLWPAMHPCTKAFWHYKDNPKIAAQYDIVLGSSHCEPMLRNNVYEWQTGYKTEFNEDPGDFNYATNASHVQKYWEARVKEAKDQDAIYTIGMRGVHDGGIQGYSTTVDKVKGLTDIIAYQRSLLTKYHDDCTQVPQLFIPYKEVLDAYNAGLKVPDDVTLCWVDDNHGYMRQLSNTSEQARSGGAGVYYHLSYWGSPQDYLWLCSTSPSLISYELSKAYAMNTRNQWIINVGDIKPAEMELQFAMDLAWDVDAWSPEKASGYIRHWAEETFGNQYADDIASIKKEYYRLAANGKPEHINFVTYSNADMDERIKAYQEIANNAQIVYDEMPERLKDAYFQLVLYPVKAAYLMNLKTFRARQSFTYAYAGQGDIAMQYASDAKTAFNDIKSLTATYNQLGNGKWNGIMSWQPRYQSQFNMPDVATQSNVATQQKDLSERSQTTVLGSNYKSASASICKLDGLGVGGSSIGVWPLDKTTYSADDITKAPYAEYELPLQQGENSIEVRCLPDFPLNADYKLRFAASIDGGTPQLYSIQTKATSTQWDQNVLRGFASGKFTVNASSAHTAKVRVYLADPALVISEVRSEYDPANKYTAMIVNNDFELKADGVTNDGTTVRGVPYGWTAQINGKEYTSDDDLSATQTAFGGKSFGINKDGKNLNGSNLCWFNGQPMPNDFKLYQKIDGLDAGTYIVKCRLVQAGNFANCRLFANNNVQYYGKPADYAKNLTEGEHNTFAGYGSDWNYNLKEMSVKVTIAQGESLTLGIHTSNLKNDGNRETSDRAGWFKVDYFRILPDDGTTNEDDYSGWIKNGDFTNKTTDWTITGNKSSNKISTTAKANGLIAGNQNHLQFWTGSNVNAALEQSITGLPEGTYKVRATIVPSYFSGTAQLYANNKTTNIKSSTPREYAVQCEVGQDGKLTLGFKADASGSPTFDIDNFSLSYVEGYNVQPIAKMSIGDLKDYYWATLYTNMPLVIPDGAKAFIVNKVEGNVAYLAEVTGNLAANQGYIIATPTAGKVMEFERSATEPDAVSGNMLRGDINEVEDKEAGYLYYILGRQGSEPAYTYGFFWQNESVNGTADGTAVVSAANKAYIKVPVNSEQAKAITLRLDNETTGIKSLSTTGNNQHKGWYTLDGRQLKGHPMEKGIYIHNNKKMIIK